MNRRRKEEGGRRKGASCLSLIARLSPFLLPPSSFLLRLIPLLIAALPVQAHDRTVSYSTWELAGARARITARLTALDVSRLPWIATVGGAELERRLGEYLAAALTLRDGSVPCPITQPPVRLATGADRLAFRWEVTCPSPARLALHSEVLRDVATGHLHFARVRRDGTPPRERVLTEDAPVWNLAGDGVPVSSFAGYVRIGVEHILTGYDHLVFLLGLLLLGGTLRDVVRIVTGFTIAHSLTLGLAVFGVVRPPGAPIEALIGLSIALVAAENLWLAARRPDAPRWMIGAVLLALALAALRGHGSVPALTLAGLALFTVCYFGLLERAERPAPLRTAIAFLFGLVHGFGFAGVLLDAELPTQQLATALFGFNLGVELAQVAAVIALWPVLNLVGRWNEGRPYQNLVEYGSAAILAVGVFWFVSRAYGS